MEKADADYMAMLNNKTINPDRQPQPAKKQVSSAALNTATPFAALMEAYHAINEVAKGLILVSESDESFDWVTADWDSNELPSPEQLVELGLADVSQPCRTKELGEFFGPMTTGDDPYKQTATYRTLHQRLQEVFGNNPHKVYLLGEGEITVLVIGIVDQADNHARAIAGLRSLMVQT